MILRQKQEDMNMKKKRILFRAVCVLSCVGMLGISPSIWNGSVVKAADETAAEEQNLEDFEIVDGRLLKYKGTADVVTVPDGVTCIGTYALYDSAVNEVVLPDSVEEIEDYAICLGGTNKLTVGTGLKKIGEKAIGIGVANDYYLGPRGEDYDLNMDWAEDIKLYGPEDSIAKEYAKKYGMIYNDEVTCILDKKELYVFNVSQDIIRIYWDIQHNVDGYYVYKSETANGEYKKIAEVKQKYGPQNAYTDTDCKPGKKYYYKVRVYRNDTINNKLLISDTAMQVSAVARLTKVGDEYSAQISANTSTSLKISWDPVRGTQVYTVWRAEQKKGPFKKLKTVKTSIKYISREENYPITYTDKKISFGKTYYYKVKAVNLSNPAVNGLASEILSGTVGIGHVTLQVYRRSSGAVEILYYPNISIPGIILYRKDKNDPNAKNQKIATIKMNKSWTYVDKTAKKGKDYIYTIKPYVKKNGKTYYGVTESASTS